MADAIFISYRRDDSEGEAGRLFDDLTRAFGNEAVFMDVAGIKPGVDFRKAIDDNVATCGVFLAIVGPTWATITNSAGVRRLDDPNDFVALELSSALKREVPVIPVLVHDAKMPAVGLLPESLQAFAYRNSVELSHARWNSDVALLIEALKQYVTPKTASDSPIHATVPVQLPAPHHPAGAAVPVEIKSKTPMIAGIGISILVIAAIIFFATRTTHVPTPDPDHPAVMRPDSTPAPATEYLGTWKRTDGPGDGDALGEVIVSGSGANFIVHAYGRCQAPACDWGQQPGVFAGSNLVATFSPPPNGSDTSRTAMVTMHPAPGGLDVLVHNNFQNPAGPHASNSHHVFSPAQ